MSLVELKEINEQLTTLSGDASANTQLLTDLIAKLKAYNVTPTDLKAASLHITINNLKKSTVESVANAAKDLINHWKTAPKSAATTTTTPSNNESNSNPVPPPVPTPKSTTTTTETTLPPPIPKTDSEKKVDVTPLNKNSEVQLPPPIPLQPPSMTAPTPSSSFKRKELKTSFLLAKTGSESRNKVQNLFYATFEAKNVDEEFRIELAVSIEGALFSYFQSEDTPYKQRVRKILANLKDPKNPDFIEALLEGAIDPRDLPTLDDNQMASKEAQNRIKEQKDYEIARRTTDDGSSEGKGVDMFQCPQCRKRECTYTQRQTRSADEPMTIFCRCIPCGKRFKIYP